VLNSDSSWHSGTSASSGDIALSDLDLKLIVASYSPSDTFNDDVNFEDNYSVGANVSLNLFEEEQQGHSRRKLTLRSLKTNFAETATKYASR